MGNLQIEIPEGYQLLVYAGIVDCLMPYNALKRVENIICDALISGTGAKAAGGGSFRHAESPFGVSPHLLEAEVRLDGPVR